MKRVKAIIVVFCFAICFLFVGCKNENKKSLSTPEILSIENGEIVFSQVDFAEYYTLTINGRTINIDVDYGPNVKIIDDEIHYDATKIMILGEEYAIKLQAKSAERQASATTELQTYVYLPVATTPENVKIDGTVLTWDAVENATSYTVKVESNELDEDGVIKLDSKLTQTYTFSTNRFDFSSLLKDAGNYGFYVSSVYTDGENYSVSDYSTRCVYKYRLQLSTPKISGLNTQDDVLYMSTVIDENANAVEINCNGKVLTVLLNGTASSVAQNGNILTLNLSVLFPEIDFLDSSNYEIKIKANFENLDEDLRFYYDSDWSNNCSFCYKSNLDTPSLTLNSQQLTWEAIENATKYKVLVLKATEYETLYLDSNITTFEVPTGAIAVMMQAIGTKNINNSKYAFSLTTGHSFELGNFASSNNVISWNDVSQNYAFVVSEQSLTEVITNQFSYSTEMQKQKNLYLKLIVVANGNVAVKDISLINNTYQLSAPIVTTAQGFSTTTLYQFSFSAVDGALGYKIKLTREDDTEFEINKIFTTTTVDLSQYLKDADGDIKSVAVKAVADEFSNKLDSAYSLKVGVVREKSLNAPTLYAVNDTVKCVASETVGEITKYYLMFYGVKNAYQYEVLINYSLKTITADDENPTKLYKLDISNYLVSANRYDISVRAIADPSSTTLKDSSYVYYTYNLKMQLKQVTNINVVENEGKYTLSFDHVANAKEYQVRIVKLNDNGYSEYLSTAQLNNPFTVADACDLPEAYLQQSGKYYIYMTAVPDESGYYAISNESQEFETVEKLTTLKTPSNIKVEKGEANEINLTFVGDANADFYIITIVDGNNFESQFNCYDNAKASIVKCNIAQYIQDAGNYTIKVKAQISATSESAKTYESGATAEITYEYRLTDKQDFERYLVSIYNRSSSNYIENANDLATVLWYNYLYEIDEGTRLSIKLDLQEVDSETDETPNDAIKRLANESTNNKIYSFGSDETWATMQNGYGDADLLKFMISKILSVYPEINSQSEITVTQSATDSSIFTLYYKNTLNVEKTFDSQKSTVVDLGQTYSYLGNAQRRASTTVFAIDQCATCGVENTEQLMYAVQNGKQPLFYGDSAVTETVYTNAKAVLFAIVSPEMTDMEKATAIFDWISHAVNNNSSAELNALSQQLGVADYGKFADFYLETVFLNLQTGNKTDGEFNLGNKVATAESYSKAFALLCRIEGIEAVVVHGTRGGVIAHTWNKVKIGEVWYVVDLLLSDNLLLATNTVNSKVQGTANSSHTYFMVSSAFQNSIATVKEIDQVSTANCASTFDYYGNANYTLTNEQAGNAHNNLKNQDCGFTYSKQYSKTNSYRVLELDKLSLKVYDTNFETYLSNLVVLAKYQLKSQSNVAIEIKIKQADNTAGNVLGSPYLKGDISNALETYGSTQQHLKIDRYNTYYHNYVYNSVDEYFVLILYFKA